jgi:DNA-binding transcriptional LysR family regulator
MGQSVGLPSRLDDLSVFVAIARGSGVSAASAKLGVPKSSVSRALARLEASLGVELVHRTTRRSRLSTAGEALLERVGPLLSELDAVVAKLPDREPSPAGLLRITCTVDFGATVLAEIVTRFVARYPEVSVDVQANNALVDLIAGGFDAGIRFSPHQRMTDSALVARRLGALHAQIVASPAYLARKGTPRAPQELARHDWITYVGAEAFVLEAPGEVQRLVAKGRIHCNDMFFAHAAVRAGGGITLLPSFLAQKSIATGELLPVMPRWQIRSGSIWFVHPAARNLPAKATAFRDFVAAELARHPP